MPIIRTRICGFSSYRAICKSRRISSGMRSRLSTSVSAISTVSPSTTFVTWISALRLKKRPRPIDAPFFCLCPAEDGSGIPVGSSKTDGIRGIPQLNACFLSRKRLVSFEGKLNALQEKRLTATFRVIQLPIGQCPGIVAHIRNFDPFPFFVHAKRGLVMLRKAVARSVTKAPLRCPENDSPHPASKRASRRSSHRSSGIGFAWKGLHKGHGIQSHLAGLKILTAS